MKTTTHTLKEIMIFMAILLISGLTIFRLIQNIIHLFNSNIQETNEYCFFALI